MLGRKASLAGPVQGRAGVREAGSGPSLDVMTMMAGFVGTLRAPLSACGPGPRKSLAFTVPWHRGAFGRAGSARPIVNTYKVITIHSGTAAVSGGTRAYVP